MRGQLFTLDFILGLMITVSAIVTVVVFIPEHEAPFVEEKERLSTLMTEGVPPEWDAATVLRPGFLTDGRFNETKIAEFASLDDEDQRALLGIRSNHTIRFYANGAQLDLCLTCGTEPDLDTVDSVGLVQRYALYDSNVTLMEVRLYE